MSWLLAFLGFAVLIILHEAGHFAAAKAVGMRVERFSLFFPPLLARVRRGETEYAIGAVPLGGYVKITGMNPEEKLPPEIAARGYYHQPVWKRIVVILAGPAMSILTAFVIFFTARSHDVSVTFSGSSPFEAMTSPIVSKIWLSSVTLPFSFGFVSSSSTELMSPPTFAGS